MGFGVEMALHQCDRFRNDSLFRSFFPGMHQTDGAMDWIEKENGAAICDINSETDIVLVGYEAVASVEATIG